MTLAKYQLLMLAGVLLAMGLSSPPAVGASFPLFVGHGDTTEPAYLIEPSSNALVPVFVGTRVSGAAYDSIGNRVLFTDQWFLYEWPIGGTVNFLGQTTIDGVPREMSGLAYYGGTLFGSYTLGDTIYTIDLDTYAGTPFITLGGSAHIKGLAADPTTGELYGTDDGSNLSLVRINLDGSVTIIAPYQGGELNVDGLAISPDRLAFLITDDPDPDTFDVYDLAASSYVGTVVNPWTTSFSPAGGAWISDAEGRSLLVGSASLANPATHIDLETGAAIPLFPDRIYGAAYDPNGARLLFTWGTSLYEKPIGGAVNLLGTIDNGSDVPIVVQGLAFYGGTLYGNSLGADKIYIIDLDTLVATTHITFTIPFSGVNGLAADPTTGELYASDDLTEALVRINLDGTLTTIAPYLGGGVEDDVDGLAIDSERRVYLLTDDPTPPYFNVYDLDTSSWVETVPYPWLGTASQVGGAIVPAMAIFGDGFESGNTSAWSNGTP